MKTLQPHQITALTRWLAIKNTSRLITAHDYPGSYPRIKLVEQINDHMQSVIVSLPPELDARQTTDQLNAALARMSSKRH